MRILKGNRRGFTVIELVVAVALTGIATAAIYKSFSAQTNVYTVQGQIVDMQQNVRAGTDLMLRELRMAGYDPTSKSPAGFQAASATSVRFSADLTGDGDITGANEDITYSQGNDADGVPCLLRQAVGDAAAVPVAENIDKIEFCYTMADGTKTTAPTNLTKIRSIQVTLRARSATKEKQITQYFNGYTSPGGDATWNTNDGYKRRISTFTVRCRNMGFKL